MKRVAGALEWAKKLDFQHNRVYIERLVWGPPAEGRCLREILPLTLMPTIRSIP